LPEGCHTHAPVLAAAAPAALSNGFSGRVVRAATEAECQQMCLEGEDVKKRLCNLYALVGTK